MLNDILDLEREDIACIPGMSPESADQLMSFLAELTEEGGEEATRGMGDRPDPARAARC